MSENPCRSLDGGIISVLQTPFDSRGQVDYVSIDRLIEYAIDGGVRGLLAPAVASEVEFLSLDERAEIVSRVAASTAQRVPLIVGASSGQLEESRKMIQIAEKRNAAAYLVAVPQPLYGNERKIEVFFKTLASESRLPLMIQDLQWNGPGLPVSTIARLKESIPSLAGIKIETVPSGPKYTGVKKALGMDFFVCGGWAVPQMIEALDRGVDAMIPESAMVRVYAAIHDAHARGERDWAVRMFRELLPILSFTNQEIFTSIAFFKRLLMRRGVFQSAAMRGPWEWDEYNEAIADDLIELYLGLEAKLELSPP